MVERRRKEGRLIGRAKKLTDEHIGALEELREENRYSYSTLAAIALSEFVTGFSMKTVYNYLRGNVV